MLCWLDLTVGEGRAAVRAELDALLADARAHRATATVAELLAIGVAARVHGGRRADVDGADALLAEYSEHARRTEDARMLGEAATLRAQYDVIVNLGDNALIRTAESLAVLTEVSEPGGDERTRWSRSMARWRSALVQVLLAQGSHEIADEVCRRGVPGYVGAGSQLDRLVHQLNRTRLQLSWALRLERGGRLAAATGRWIGTVQAAAVGSRLWASVLDRSGADGAQALLACPIIAAAYALHRPGPQHLDTLTRLAAITHHADDRIALAIATARCHLADARPEAAVAALGPLRDTLENGSEVGLTFALHRQIALADAVARRREDPSGREESALRRYAAVLERELWGLHEANISALRSHCENFRLSREHGAVTAQLLEDPLTGLPNRRAVDRQLLGVTSEANQPCAVALIDLDRFKDVNDGRSHAVGDEVLREIAATVRRMLRADDVVGRYGGDEFVVIMPDTPLPDAIAALERATGAVAGLPTEVASGVTMSVGVVGALPGVEPAATLAAADEAMYQAKHLGGNRVISAPNSPPTEPHPHRRRGLDPAPPRHAPLGRRRRAHPDPARVGC